MQKKGYILISLLLIATGVGYYFWNKNKNPLSADIVDQKSAEDALTKAQDNLIQAQAEATSNPTPQNITALQNSQANFENAVNLLYQSAKQLFLKTATTAKKYPTPENLKQAAAAGDKYILAIKKMSDQGTNIYVQPQNIIYATNAVNAFRDGLSHYIAPDNTWINNNSDLSLGEPSIAGMEDWAGISFIENPWLSKYNYLQVSAAKGLLIGFVSKMAMASGEDAANDAKCTEIKNYALSQGINLDQNIYSIFYPFCAFFADGGSKQYEKLLTAANGDKQKAFEALFELYKVAVNKASDILFADFKKDDSQGRNAAQTTTKEAWINEQNYNTSVGGYANVGQQIAGPDSFNAWIRNAQMNESNEALGLGIFSGNQNPNTNLQNAEALFQQGYKNPQNGNIVQIS